MCEAMCISIDYSIKYTLAGYIKLALVPLPVTCSVCTVACFNFHSPNHKFETFLLLVQAPQPEGGTI